MKIIKLQLIEKYGYKNTRTYSDIYKYINK